MGVRTAFLTAAFVSLGFGAAAYADYQPIEGQKLILRRTATRATLIFVSRDPYFLFPAIGGPDDPATGSPGGATVELFSASEGQASLAAPVGAGDPGWTVTSTPTARYKFHNRPAPAGISPVRVAVLSQGKMIKIVAKDPGLPLAVPQGAVGIRITTGTLQSCARFAGATIRKDDPGTFVASHAPRTANYDCSDESLNGVPPSCEGSPYPACTIGTCPGDGTCIAFPSCHCIAPSQPCGDTSPACFGTCPAGEECFSVGPGPLPGCVCLPEGSTPCGSPGAPVCGGACPSGTSCEPIFQLPIFGGLPSCTCAPPGDCGAGGVDCPNGFGCAVIPPSTIFCAPVPCFGSNVEYPTCGGTCVSGAECQPYKLGEYETCLCAIPAPCDSACGGYTCAGGDVCTTATGPSATCSCEAP
jgi:hypothetical protein